MVCPDQAFVTFLQLFQKCLRPFLWGLVSLILLLHGKSGESSIFALEKGKTSYTDNRGLLSLRKEISTYVENHFGPAYDPENEILVTVGVSEAIDIALRALINPGDKVMYHEPCYVSYAPSISLAFGEAISCGNQSG